MFFAKKNKLGHEKDPRFPAIDGLNYYDVLKGLLGSADPEWYLEIGSRNGRSLSQSTQNYIAIDPQFDLQYHVINSAKKMFFFQQTSDNFFSSKFLQNNGIKPGVSFIDGMHLFEFALRDFINCEATMESSGLICLHDVCPYNSPQTTRDISYMTELKRPWTGDVWKLVVILQRYRPDLKIDILKASSTGFACVSNLDANNTDLIDKYDSILEQFIDLTFEEYNPESYYASFKLQDPAEYLQSLR